MTAYKSFKIIKRKLLESKIHLFISIAVAASIVAIGFDLIDNHFTFHDILVEYHGLVYDLIVFGIILTIYETIKDKKDKITRYKEEIDDFRFWHSEESMHKIKGSVNRLYELGVESIDLSMCEFSNSRWLNKYKKMKWDFTGAKLGECLFISTDISKSRFRVTNLTNVSFVQSNLSGCNFGSSTLKHTLFEECDLNGTDFKGAIVDCLNWIDELESKKNIGINYIRDCFYVDTVGANDNIIYKVFVNSNSKFYEARSIYDW